MSSFPGLQDYFEDDDVLFREEPWAILSTDKLAGYMNQVSVIGHKCDQFDVVQFLDEEDAIVGECWWCKHPIPESIQALWKMHNWEALPGMRVYASDKEWEALKPYNRLNKKFTQVNHATATTHKAKRIVPTGKKKSDTWGPLTPHGKSQTIVGRYKAP